MKMPMVVLSSGIPPPCHRRLSSYPEYAAAIIQGSRTRRFCQLYESQINSKSPQTKETSCQNMAVLVKSGSSPSIPDEELPRPDTVRKARMFFESGAHLNTLGPDPEFKNRPRIKSHSESRCKYDRYPLEKILVSCRSNPKLTVPAKESEPEAIPSSSSKSFIQTATGSSMIRWPKFQDQKIGTGTAIVADNGTPTGPGTSIATGKGTATASVAGKVTATSSAADSRTEAAHPKSIGTKKETRTVSRSACATRFSTRTWTESRRESRVGIAALTGAATRRETGVGTPAWTGVGTWAVSGGRWSVLEKSRRCSADTESSVSETSDWSSAGSDWGSSDSSRHSLFDQDVEGRYVSPQVLQKIRAYGRSFRYVNGRMIDDNGVELESPTSNNKILNKIRRDSLCSYSTSETSSCSSPFPYY